jgi:hypothetical protein
MFGAMIAKDMLDRLIVEGRAKGFVDTQDLIAALPVQSMSPEEIALVVVHLEDAGVPVELDESLLAGRATLARPVNAPDFLAPARPVSLPSEERRPLEPVLRTDDAEEAANASSNRSAGSGGAHAAVLIGGVIAAASIVALLVLILR